MSPERPDPPLGPRAGPVSARAARVLYNVADALLEGDAPDGTAVDVLPGVEDRIRWKGVGAARRTWLLLMALEWLPVVSLRARRPFSQLPRARRCALLAGWSGRASFEELRRWIAEAAEDAAKAVEERASEEGGVPAPDAPQSSGA